MVNPKQREPRPCECTTKEVLYTSIIEGVMVSKSYIKRKVCERCKVARTQGELDD